jgi:hypothetical protein
MENQTQEIEKIKYADNLRKYYHFGEGTGCIEFMKGLSNEEFDNTQQVFDNKSTKYVLLRFAADCEKKARMIAKEQDLSGKDFQDEVYGHLAHSRLGETFTGLIMTALRGNPNHILNVMQKIRQSRRTNINISKCQMYSLIELTPEQASEKLGNTQKYLNQCNSLEGQMRVFATR